MTKDNTLQLLAWATGLTATDIATAIPRAGVATVKAWLSGDKVPGKDQINALARTFGVPAGALLSELASTFDPARTKGEHDLLAAYRAPQHAPAGCPASVNKYFKYAKLKLSWK